MCQMCLMSLCSRTTIIAGDHTLLLVSKTAGQGGRELLIDYLVGDGGGRDDGNLLALTILHPSGGNKRYIILGQGVMLCGVIWVADFCFKACIVLLFRNGSSRCPLPEELARVSMCSVPQI